MNRHRPGKYRTLGTLARGTVFHLSAFPADTKSWRVLRHIDGRSEVERLHEDKTAKIQRPKSTLIVFIPDVSDEPTAEDIADVEQELEDMGVDIDAERQASRERTGGPRDRKSMLGSWESGSAPKAPLGDGGYLTLKTPTEGD